MGLPITEAKQHSELMDRNYRLQRHVYDLTRKFYLLGRDKLLRKMDVRPGDRVLEVGCGTGRNLIKLAGMRDCELFGLDASRMMLKKAKKKIARRGLLSRIKLKVGLAEDLTPEMFALDRPFDTVFFSYSLSMIPGCETAFAAAMANVKPGGTIYIVDFWDQRDLPGWFQWVLKRFLARYHVEHRPDFLDYLNQLVRDGRGTMEFESLTGRYAYIASFKCSDVVATSETQTP